MLKVRLSPFKKIIFIYFSENPLEMIKHAFYFMLKAKKSISKSFIVLNTKMENENKNFVFIFHYSVQHDEAYGYTFYN